MTLEWMSEGSCRGLAPETFFPSDSVGVDVARHVCARCPVRTPCLEYALDNHLDHGVWAEPPSANANGSGASVV